MREACPHGCLRIALQCGFTSAFAAAPTCVASENAAYSGGSEEEPRLAAVGNQPEQKEIGTARQWKREDARVEDSHCE